REVATLHRSLVSHGFSAIALHGDMDQSARTAALEQFRRGEVKLLVASDVAARGLDIPAVSHVFNFDVPHHPDDYVHRIGRTGRAGRSGTALTIVAPSDSKALDAIEKLTGQPIAWTNELAPSAEAPQPREHREPREQREQREPRPRRHDAPRREQSRRDQPERQEPPAPKVAHIEEARSRRPA